MQFLNNIKSSIYDPEFYKELLNKPFSYSLRYFLVLAGLIAIVSTIVFSFSTLQEINKVISEIGPNVLKYYPDELVITAKNGKISTNVQEPYYIRMPAEFKSEFQNSGDQISRTSPDLSKVENLFVIDTSSPLTTDLFYNYETFVLISRDSVAYYDNNAVKIQPLDQTVNGVLTKAKVLSALNEFMPYLKIIPFALVPIVILFLFLGFILGNLIYLIFGAFVIWLMFRIIKKNLEYGKAYQIGLHAITFIVILEATIFQILPSLEFPFLFTILTLVIVWINFKDLPVAVAVPPAPLAPTQSGEMR